MTAIYSIIQVVLNKGIILGPNSALGKTDTRVICGSLAYFLKHSLWTPELEYAFRNFSFGAFLDRVIVDGIIEDGCPWRGSQAKKFFEYLEADVSLSSCQPKFCLLLRARHRKVLNFFIIPPAIWSMPCLPSTVTPVQINSTF